MYDDSNIISNTFFTELIKNIQSYETILLQYDYNNEKLINWKNKLRSKINHNIKKEFITLRLEDILTPKKFETEDSKITNILILSIAESKMQIKDEFLIAGLQNFEQYSKINSISVWIIDLNLENKLLFYSKKYKYRFIANSLLFSSAIKEDTNAIFITTNGLNDAKDILINGKIFQGIGIIYISEIENWDKIKNKSHWTNVILTDSAFPIAAKHFAFAFETADLHNLLNFEYSLINDKGKILEFNQGEDKIPALNFTIQVI